MGAILDLPCPFMILWFCDSVIVILSPFRLKFSSQFFQELWGLGDWNLVHTWTVGRCIVYTGLKLLMLIRPFISSLFFLSNFQMSKFFVTLFSATVRPRRLKHGTYVESGQMYRVYRNQAAGFYFSLYFFIFFSLQFSNIKIFFSLFSGTMRPRRLKRGTYVDSGEMYRVYRNQAASAYSSLYFFIFLSLQFRNIKIFRHTFLRNCVALKIDTSTHVDRGQMYRV